MGAGTRPKKPIVIIHEYLHGLSNRLTGGPGNTGCLGSGEAGGMGEGWGDCYSIVLRWRSEFDTNSTDFGMGVYAAGEGIRLYDYSRNLTVNPQTYSYINGAQYGGVHAKGTCVKLCRSPLGRPTGHSPGLSLAAPLRPTSRQAASGARASTTCS